MFEGRTRRTLFLKRYRENPVISPGDSPWEEIATFNPGVIKLGNKVYIAYRAVSHNHISTIGLAVSSDGFTIDEKYDEPIYVPRASFEIYPLYRNSIDPYKPYSLAKIEWKYVSGPSYFGTEDPRLVRIGNRIYMTYVAFNGQWIMRGVISWIKVKDFKEGNWDEWSPPVPITNPVFPVKNVVIFSRPVDGKYTFYHRIYPNIWMDKVKHPYDDFAKRGRILWGRPVIKPRRCMWDSRKVGAGATPLPFLGHWLFVYNGVSLTDPYYRYAFGVMLIHRDKHDRVLYRTDEPSIFPFAWYETEEKTVCYSSGAVIHKGNLLVYYGASDKYVAVAYAPVDYVKERIKEGMEDVEETGALPVEPRAKAGARLRLAGRRRIQSRYCAIRRRIRNAVQGTFGAS